MLKSLLPRTIWFIGISFSLIVLATSYIRYWMPNNEDAKYKVENYTAYVAEAQKINQVIKKKEQAAELIKLAEAKWKPIVDTRTPSASTANGGININVNPYQLLLDTKRFRNNIQRALNKQLLVGGVKEIEGPRILGVSDSDAPNGVLASYYNYPAIPFPVVIYDLGQVQVKGTYEQIMKHVRSYSSMPRYLAVTQGLALSGTAPILTATYNLTIVGYIRHDGIYPQVPDGVALAAAPGAPGAGVAPGAFRGPQGGTSAPIGDGK